MRSRLGGASLKVDRGLQVEGPLQLADGVTLYGGSHFVCSREQPIRIGEQSHVGRNSVFSGLGGITIGKGCAISSGVLIYSITNTFEDNPEQPVIEQPVVRSPVNIGDDVWIGAGAIILPGVRVADHAVIGAGALVNRDVQAWQVVAGVPAKCLRDRRHSRAPSV